MTCLQCRKAELQEEKADFPAEVKGDPILVKGFSGLVCPNCGYKTVPGNQMQEYMRAAADAYRRKHGLLTSDEIRHRRERVNMSQDQMSRWLGVGLASVKRWELGAVQDRAMDKLIRISTDVIEAGRHYKDVQRMVGIPALPLHMPQLPQVWWQEQASVKWGRAKAVSPTTCKPGSGGRRTA